MAILLLAACEKDGDKIYLNGHESNELIATESDIVLQQEEASKVVLSLTWSKSTLSVSNPAMDAPDLELVYTQISTTNDFSANVVETLETGLSKAYTGAELNTVAKNLSIAADVATPVYIRLKSTIGNNTQPQYSNVVTVNLTAYDIDMTVGFVLDSKQESTSWTLISPEANGIYTGFMGATSWYNFYLREGDGTVWGNDGVNGSAFLLSQEDSKWNCWFPGVGGCHYVEFNTVKKEWSTIYIPVLNVSGDIEGEMTFDRPNNKWYMVFEASSAGSLKIKLQGDAKLYNLSTGDGDDTAIDTSIAFEQENGNIVLAQQAGEITVTVTEAGEYTLTVDLSDPKKWTCQASSGLAEPEPINPFVYLPGIDDGITNSDWNFDHTLSLYNEDELAYAGVINVNSLWGYSINTEENNWNDKYTLGEGDAYAGTLAWQGENNLPAPAPGLYLFEVKLKEPTYNLFNITDKIFLSGINDVWDFETVLNATDTPGIYAGNITITVASEWGFQIHTDDTWNHKFGGSEGKLYYQGSNITDDDSLEPGTYTMTVNLIEGTYILN
ncbi:DUF5114 domain-containing protein [Bacteroides sp. 519]|uniref:DUF5114 domain-containing protein n=1 Tax=Bacteroides sp. 519 TaxID=2302937 RepID=UPI001EF2A4A8|nr:DUF5114 domain-containing protein [Bacteroides sp. 519]